METNQGKSSIFVRITPLSSRPAHGRSLTGGANNARNPGQTGTGTKTVQSGVSNIFQMVLVPAFTYRCAFIKGASQGLQRNLKGP